MTPSGPRDRLRVATLVDQLSLDGGAEHLAVRIATSLDSERFASTLCVSRWPARDERGSPEALQQLERAGVPLVALRRRRKVQLAPWVRLARFLRRERVDVLHTHQFGSNLWGGVVGRLAGVPVVLAHEHTWSYEGNPMRRVLDREVISRASDRFIAVSREDQRRMIEVEGVAPERTTFIPLGISPDAPPTGHDVRAELGIPPEAPVVVAVGNLRLQKAHQVLIAAVGRVAERWPNMHVLVVGVGPRRAELERLVDELGLQRVIRFLGYRSDVPDVLAAADVAVCSSDFEGTPIAILEYMEAGVAVVSTAVGGVPDVIEHGVQGLLVPRRDPDALAGAISELLADPPRAREMGARGRERRRSEFTLEALIARLEALYRELADSKRVA